MNIQTIPDGSTEWWTWIVLVNFVAGVMCLNGMAWFQLRGMWRKWMAPPPPPIPPPTAPPRYFLCRATVWRIYTDGTKEGPFEYTVGVVIPDELKAEAEARPLNFVWKITTHDATSPLECWMKAETESYARSIAELLKQEGYPVEGAPPNE